MTLQTKPNSSTIKIKRLSSQERVTLYKLTGTKYRAGMNIAKEHLKIARDNEIEVSYYLGSFQL